jgi:hypothetical protein
MAGGSFAAPRRLAERYLRLLVERALDPFADGAVHVEDVQAAGDALVSVGLADLGLVEELTADLALALALRQPRLGPLPELTGQGPRPFLAGLPLPRSVATGPAPIGGEPGVTVVAIVFGTDGASVYLRGDIEVGPDPSESWPLPPARGVPPTPRDPGHQPGAGRGSPSGTMPALPRVGSTGPRPPSRRRSTDSGHGSPEAVPQGPARLGDRGPLPAARHRPSATAPVADELILSDKDGREYRLGRQGGVAAGEGGDGPRHWTWTESGPAASTAWLAVRRPGVPIPAVGLSVHRPLATVAARPHGRSPGGWWVLERLWSATAAFAHTSRPRLTRSLNAGVTALVALEAIDPAEPLVHQAGLLAAAVTPGGVDPALDRRWASPLERRNHQGGREAEAVWPVATTIDLGDLVVRLDTLVVDSRGAELLGAANRWSWAPPRPLALSAFDDRHNWYTLDPRTAGVPGPEGGPLDVVWDVWPVIDPAASSLRLIVTSERHEASVEIGLR